MGAAKVEELAQIITAFRLEGFSANTVARCLRRGIDVVVDSVEACDELQEQLLEGDRA